MNLFDFVILLIAAIVAFFGKVALGWVIIGALVAIIVVRLIRGEKLP